MKGLYRLANCITTNRSILKIKSVLFVLIFAANADKVFAQIYSHDFGTTVITSHPYTDPPPVIDAHISNSFWANSAGSWTSFAGSAGQAIALNNSSGTPVITFSFDIAAGYQADITGFSFWRQRSSTGATNWSITINGVSAGSGTTPVSGANTGNMTVSSANNLTGTVTIEISLSGASGTGTFRLDDFTLTGSVAAGATLSVDELAGFGDICTGTISGANTFTITGTSLSVAPVTVAALNGFSYSKDNSVYTSTLSLSHAAGAFSQTVYVKFAPMAVQYYDGIIPVSGGGATGIIQNAYGNGVNTRPALTNGTAANITTSSADINVTIGPPGCTALTSYGVEYSTTAGFANGFGTAISGGTLSGGNFVSNLSGLAPAGQVFYIHSYASNAGGITYGAENSFTLLSTTPGLSVPAAGAGSLGSFGPICVNTALVNQFNLSGSVLNGANIIIGPLSHYSFSTSPGGPFSNSLSLTQGGSGYSYAAGTLSNCTIYTRFIPTAVQSYNGNILISGGGAPSISVSATGSGINSAGSVTTAAAYSITSSGAILPGTAVDPGCGVILGYGTEYSSAPFSPGAGTQVAGSNLSGSDFSVPVNLLNPNTTYYYYAYVTNAAGISYGSMKNFSTFPVPVKLAIVSVSPVSPTALTPFSVIVQAQDAAGNPVEVTTNTDIKFNQSAGSGIFTFPNSPLPSATMPAGCNTLTVTDLSYDIAENNVGITVSAVSGMTGLGTSVAKIFNVIAYVGPVSFVWNVAGGSAWLTGSNWNTGTAPGSSTPGFNQHLASFTGAASLNLSAVGGCGINMNSVGGAYDAGAIYFSNTYAFNHVNNLVPVGNSSTTVAGTLTLWGAGVNNVGGITGNNYSSLLLGNYMSTANTSMLEIRNTIGSGNQNMILNFGSAGSVVAGPGRTININTVLSGTQDLSFTGGGTFSLTPSGAASVNNFSGNISIANGILVAGNTGAFNTVAPNIITLGSTSNAGILRLNGHNVTIGGLSTSGTAGAANIVDNGTAAATLTITNAGGYTFNGTLKDGLSGSLSLVKNGSGVMTFTGLNTFTGSTVINAGTVILSRSGGSSFSPLSTVTVNGTATLRISSDQTIKNLTLAGGGSLRVDAGIVLTVTGNYTPGTCNILNFGTIILQGTAPQSFPGTAAAVSNMNNLTINNVSGVNMNASLNIGGTLNLVSGTFTVGVYTLTLNNPLAGNMPGLVAGSSSSLVIAGTAANLNIPATITQLKNLTISNSAGTVLQGDLNISTTLFITNLAGTVDAGTNRLFGTANTTMTGGILSLSRNAVIEPELTGIYVLTSGTVLFNGVGIGSDAQFIRPINYFNLSSASNGDRVLSATGITGIANIFTPNAVSNNYTILNSTVDFNKVGPQNIAGFSYFNLSLSGGSYIKTLAANADVYGTLSLATNTKFALSNFNVTLKSTADNTAGVDVINTANSISYGTGRFSVERYIPTGIAHGKSWQLLSVPVSGTQSVKDSWQDGNMPLGNLTSGYGTVLTSEKPGATGRGFDFYTPAGPSIKTYNSGLDAWDGIDDGMTNTGALPIPNSKGYMIFVRGDRSVQSSSTPATVTTFRTMGKLFAPGTDAPPSVAVAAGKFETAGNPYASAIDFTSVISASSGIDSKYYVWDPLLPGSNGYGYGGYQLLSSVNGWKPVPGGTTNYPSNIPYTQVQSGQAIFVYSTGGGSVNFSESDKTSGNQVVFRTVQPRAGYMRAFLYGATGIMTDGNVAAFAESYTSRIDADDALKPQNLTENFGINAAGKILALEARGLVVNNDTVFYNLSNLHIQDYRFGFAPENLQPGISAWLYDRFLATTTELSISDSSFIDFSVSAEPASAESDRFFLIFKRTGYTAGTDVLTQASREKNLSAVTNEKAEPAIDIYPNPVTGNTVHAYFKNLAKGTYRVELIDQSGKVVYKNSISIANKNESLSLKLNNNTAPGIYRLNISSSNYKLVRELMVSQ